VSRHTAQLGFTPTVRFVGPLNTAIDNTLTDDILPVVGEATSNCARHARATRASITAELSERFTIKVVDNGRGIDTAEHPSGLENLRLRAKKHHDTLAVTTPDGGGTRLLWTAHTTPAP
jgi:signal transduction histidine kinase